MHIELPDFSKVRLLVIGDVMLDRYWFGHTSRVSPEAPVPVVGVNHCEDRPGGAGNVALNIASLGGQTKLIGITGKDDSSQTLKEQLSAASVACHFIQDPSLETIVKLRVISRDQQLIRLDFEKSLASFDQEILLKLFEEQVVNVDTVILSDYNKGTLKHAPKFIELAKRHNKRVIVDPKGEDYSIYQGADFITPNFKEFQSIVGTCNTESEILIRGQALIEEYNIGSLLLTRGEKGMTLIQRGMKEHHFPARGREVFDVTGAGDTVIGVFSAAIAAKKDPVQAIILANLAAGLVVGKLGAASVSVPELWVALESEDGSGSGCLNVDQLKLAVDAARLKGERIVFTNGCFDLLHAGHVAYLKQAKQYGDRLVVGINSDDSITRLKGKGRPINTLDQRMAVLASLGVVDWVVPFTEDTPKSLLKEIKPEVLVKGGDYKSVDEVVGHEIVKSYGGEVKVLDLIEDLSSTAIIDKITAE